MPLQSLMLVMHMILGSYNTVSSQQDYLYSYFIVPQGDVPVPTDESSKPRRTGIPCVGTTSVILTASIQLKVLLEF